MTKRFWPWFDSLNKVYQLAVIIGTVVLALASSVGMGYGALAYIIDSRVAARVEPIQDMVEFILTDSGRWEKYLEQKAKREHNRKAFESKVTATKGPDFNWRIP